MDSDQTPGVKPPQGFGAKLVGTILGPMFRGATKKAIVQDLDDIAAAAEALSASA
jgi:hypothetical protein